MINYQLKTKEEAIEFATKFKDYNFIWTAVKDGHEFAHWAGEEILDLLTEYNKPPTVNKGIWRFSEGYKLYCELTAHEYIMVMKGKSK